MHRQQQQQQISISTSTTIGFSGNTAWQQSQQPGACYQQPNPYNYYNYHWQTQPHHQNYNYQHYQHHNAPQLAATAYPHQSNHQQQQQQQQQYQQPHLLDHQQQQYHGSQSYPSPQTHHHQQPYLEKQQSSTNPHYQQHQRAALPTTPPPSPTPVSPTAGPKFDSCEVDWNESTKRGVQRLMPSVSFRDNQCFYPPGKHGDLLAAYNKVKNTSNVVKILKGGFEVAKVGLAIAML